VAPVPLLGELALEPPPDLRPQDQVEELSCLPDLALPQADLELLPQRLPVVLPKGTSTANESTAQSFPWMALLGR
jgi:hypothetical protein